MQLSSKLECFEFNVWQHYLPIPSTVAKKFIEGDNRRIKCTINKKIVLHCALMPSHGDFFILMNKENIKKLSIKQGDSVDLEIEKDNSEYGMPVPESFEMLLEQDEVGSKYFHELTPGKQRSLIYIISKLKNIDSQLNKGLAILEHLRDTKGQIEYKMLNETIKRYNQRSRLK